MMDMYDTHCATSNSNTTSTTSSNKSENKDKMIYGWICPVCGKGVSPYTSYCNCKINEYSISNSTINSAPDSDSVYREAIRALRLHCAEVK